MPRDYLREASSIIFGDKVSLASLVEDDVEGVLNNLFRVLDTAQGMMGPSLRKAAVYALGQIGDLSTLTRLQDSYREQHNPPGVQEAMAAAMTAIKVAPSGTGYSQLDRRQIIEDVYDGRRPADWE
jgi:hypothetical protein